MEDKNKIHVSLLNIYNQNPNWNTLKQNNVLIKKFKNIFSYRKLICLILEIQIL
jgi:hypothetical protein